MNTEKPRILTGIRPTGSLHLGHYGGALENWLKLQKEYDCFFLIADYQVSDYADNIDNIREWVIEVAIDWLSVGLDPDLSHFAIESLIPEHTELTTWLSWWVPLGRLQRNPTLKTEMNDLGESVPVAFFTYPVMQVANILMPRAHLVPVGEDQLPHIEMTREIARRFNRLFGNDKEIFPVPKALVGRVPRLVGIDGPDAKMSKSKNNAIWLKDDSETVTKKVMRMYTDPSRLRATDPGHIEGNPVFMYHDAFNPDIDEVDDLKKRYVLGKVGDVEVKTKLATALNQLMDPWRERRDYFETHPELVIEALRSGTEHYRTKAQETMEMVRGALKLDYLQKD
jgi:tryptophanyl-tRNA synthetase